MKISPLKNGFRAELKKIAADKSISHRFAIFSMLCEEKCHAKNYLLAQDTLNTLKIVQNLGAKVKQNADKVEILAPKTIKSPAEILDCGNSGTAMRLMVGFLASCEGFFVLSGDRYLNERPMRRVSTPLREIGAKIYGRENANFAPLCVEGGRLKGFEFTSKISSAQVKTAMILAAFRANSASKFSEPELSRNHSENMLLSMGAPLKISKNALNIEISPLKKPLKPLNITIPNDPSSAFYFAVAAAILPNSRVILKNVLLNKTRIEAFELLKKMGAKLEFKVLSDDFEKVGEIRVESSVLHAVSVSERISWLIDEAPALAIAFACARGVSRLVNAAELRVKECDRIKAVVANLQKCGVRAKELKDGFEIEGIYGNLDENSALNLGKFSSNEISSTKNLIKFKDKNSALNLGKFNDSDENLNIKNAKNSALNSTKFESKNSALNLSKNSTKIENKNSALNLGKNSTKIYEKNVIKNAKIQSFGDHRIAMSFAIWGLKFGVKIDEVECVKTSFPNFFNLLENLAKQNA